MSIPGSPWTQRVDTLQVGRLVLVRSYSWASSIYSSDAYAFITKCTTKILYALPFEDPQALPDTFFYRDTDYVFKKTYCAQPENDGQAAGITSEINKCRL